MGSFYIFLESVPCLEAEVMRKHISVIWNMQKV